MFDAICEITKASLFVNQINKKSVRKVKRHIEASTDAWALYQIAVLVDLFSINIIGIPLVSNLELRIIGRFLRSSPRQVESAIIEVNLSSCFVLSSLFIAASLLSSIS